MKEYFQLVPTIIWIASCIFYLTKRDKRTYDQRYYDALILIKIFFLFLGSFLVTIALGLLAFGIGHILGEIPIIGIVFNVIFKIIGASVPVMAGLFLLKATVEEHKIKPDDIQVFPDYVENYNEIGFAIMGVFTLGLEFAIYFEWF